MKAESMSPAARLKRPAIHIEVTDYGRNYNLWIGFYDNEGDFWTGEPIVFKKQSKEEVTIGAAPEPTVGLNSLMGGKEFFEALYAELKRTGFVDHKIEQSNEIVKATQAHLQDMRTIAFDSFKKILNEKGGSDGRK